MKIKNKIIWRKPDYKNEYRKVSDKDIDGCCLDRTESGDIKIERTQYGRKITFAVYRVEKIGELVEGIDTLSRHRAIEELKKVSSLNLKKESQE